MESQQGKSMCLQMISVMEVDCYYQRIVEKHGGKAPSQRMK